MNFVLGFLTEHWGRLGLDRCGSSSGLSCVVVTPRFRASRHVILLVLNGRGAHPIAVVKVPRLASDHGALDREAANLLAVQEIRRGGFDSIPRLIAYEKHRETRLLVESALAGQTMKPAMVRRRATACAEAVMAWLVNLTLATMSREASSRDSFSRLVARPLEDFARWFPLLSEEKRVVEQTQELTEPLSRERIPLVYEHGDLSAPNILVLEDGRAGVVDWELAEPAGLPAADLLFFLTFLAFARRRAEKQEDYQAAFREAFFGEAAWARWYVARYAACSQLSSEAIRALFFASWSRYVIRLAWRVGGFDGPPGEVLAGEAADWLRQNRFFVLWRYAVEHAHELNLFH